MGLLLLGLLLILNKSNKEFHTQVLLGACSGVAKAGAWLGTCPAKARPTHVCTSPSVVSTMVKRTAGARPIPMTWLCH